MLSNRPYLIRAFYQWIVDNACTPIAVINVSYPGHGLPKEYIENDEIVLAIGPKAIRNLNMDNNKMSFMVSFSGVQYSVSCPIGHVISLYAEENGEGVYFETVEEPIIQTKPSLQLVPPHPSNDKK